MKNIVRKWDVFSKEERGVAIKKIIAHFKEERDEELGLVASEELLDFFLQEVGLVIQDTVVQRNKSWVKERLEELEIDFDELS